MLCAPTDIPCVICNEAGPGSQLSESEMRWWTPIQLDVATNWSCGMAVSMLVESVGINAHEDVRVWAWTFGRCVVELLDWCCSFKAKSME